jgi:phage terminase large subunit GpA-like protein
MISLELQNRLRNSLLPSRPPLMLVWAESTVVIPDGPLKGTMFDASVQPFSRLFLAEIDSGKWDRVVAAGPTQTGKTLNSYVLPVLYHLFAIGESVVAGLPTADMADDKWREDFLPVIEASPELRHLLPVTGQGSRSGRVRTRVKFRNGATLRFMTGGGNDKTRAGYTARVLAVTEVDGLDVAGAASREADKLKQLEARQRAYLASGIRTYLECTVTTTNGRIWQEYISGTESRIARPCPHCKVYVSPGRESIVGWQEADNELEARAAAAWSCPSCGARWTEAERYAANLKSVLVHRGQEVTTDGKVTGQRRMEVYYVPKKVTDDVRFIGNGYHLAQSGRGGLLLVHINADAWKSELHSRLALPPESQLALLLFETTDPAEHREFAEQLTAEKQTERYVEGRGESIVWERVRRENHYLDSAYSAVAAGDLILSLATAKPVRRAAVISRGLQRSDGSPWIPERNS